MPNTKNLKPREAAFEALPLEEQVRRRAYELYVQRGNQSGSEFDDWLQAETEVRDTSERAEQIGGKRSRHNR